MPWLRPTPVHGILDAPLVHPSIHGSHQDESEVNIGKSGVFSSGSPLWNRSQKQNFSEAADCLVVHPLAAANGGFLRTILIAENVRFRALRARYRNGRAHATKWARLPSLFTTRPTYVVHPRRVQEDPIMFTPQFTQVSLEAVRFSFSSCFTRMVQAVPLARGQIGPRPKCPNIEFLRIGPRKLGFFSTDGFWQIDQSSIKMKFLLILI